MLTTMDYQKTVQALKRLRVETGSLACFGCGHEHNCSTQGCAILRNAAAHMEAALANYDHLSALTKQQAEDIQALEHATLTPPNEWVSVDEKLPKEKQRVIVRCERVGTSVGWILWGNWMADIGPDAGKVTHWMPLPAPPKE